MKLSIRTITKEQTTIFFGTEALESLNKQLNSLIRPPGNVFILVDPNTRRYCLPVLIDTVSAFKDAKVLELTGGEHCKSMDNAVLLWQKFHQEGVDRNTLIVNLGGGVVSDLGGFVAGGYQRGIRYINIPTSLMAQADAAIGGKTGVNLEGIKNQIGLFYSPAAVFVFPGFLKTLPANHLRSGLAEIIKSILLSNSIEWQKLNKHPINELLLEPLDGVIWKRLMKLAIAYKVKLVNKDCRERNIRKALNFGHTIGHALESHSMNEWKKPLLHGEAIAAGMICAAMLSHKKTGLGLQKMKEIIAYLSTGFSAVPITPDKIYTILDAMKYDKKNQEGQFRFTLLTAPGTFKTNVSCERAEVSEVLMSYLAEQNTNLL